MCFLLVLIKLFIEQTFIVIKLTLFYPSGISVERLKGKKKKKKGKEEKRERERKGGRGKEESHMPRPAKCWMASGRIVETNWKV